jgi:hypothetical protein
VGFEEWFTKTVADTPVLTIDISTPASSISSEVTREYVDINNRMLISLYVIDAFGMQPRNVMHNQLAVANRVVEPPRPF